MFSWSACAYHLRFWIEVSWSGGQDSRPPPERARRPANRRHKCRRSIPGAVPLALRCAPDEMSDPSKKKPPSSGADPLIVGSSAHVVHASEHILGKSLHPEVRKAKQPA